MRGLPDAPVEASAGGRMSALPGSELVAGPSAHVSEGSIPAGAPPGASPLPRAGWPWTVVTVDTREAYMAAPEEASVRQDIVPFTRFLAESATASARMHRA